MSETARRVLMLVQHRVRDLEGHALVAHHLARRHGHEVAFSDADGLEDSMFRFEPDAVVIDALVWDVRVRLAALARRLGVRVLMLPVAGLYESDEDYARDAGKLTGSSDLIDSYLAWGPAPRRAVLHGGLLTEDRVRVVGCPRFDLYSKPYLALMESREKLLQGLGIHNVEAPLILWSTNTSNFARADSGWAERKAARCQIPVREIVRDLEDEREQFTQHAKTFVELARRRPGWNFVIKIHPIEPIESYSPFAADVPNIFLAFDGPIRHLLHHSLALFQRGCTTATEAWMLGRPVLEVSTGRYHREWAPESFRAGNQVVRSVDEAESALCGILDGASIAPEQVAARTQFLGESFFRIDGMSGRRTADAIASALAPPAYSDAQSLRTRQAVRRAGHERRAREEARFSRRVKSVMGVPHTTSLRFWRFFGGSQRSAALLTASPAFDEATIRSLYTEFERLEREGAA